MHNYGNNIKIINIILIFIIFICILYIRHLTLLIKKLETVDLSIIANKNVKDELLEMCYKSRSLYYSKERKLNETNLNTIQQKLNFLMVHESPDFKSKIADKILLHDYSIKKLGFDLCVPIINIYNNSEQIKLEELPDKFVLKCNHGSGMNILCNNKSKFDINNAKSLLNNWKNINYGLTI